MSGRPDELDPLPPAADAVGGQPAWPRRSRGASRFASPRPGCSNPLSRIYAHRRHAAAGAQPAVPHVSGGVPRGHAGRKRERTGRRVLGGHSGGETSSAAGCPVFSAIAMEQFLLAPRRAGGVRRFSAVDRRGTVGGLGVEQAPASVRSPPEKRLPRGHTPRCRAPPSRKPAASPE